MFLVSTILAQCATDTREQIIRDPRYGRNSELPSEDPTLSGHYASEMVRGMQEGPDTKYMKVHASLKHYTAYVRAGGSAATGDSAGQTAWNHYSDSKVTAVTHAQVLRAQAFLLFYTRVG